MKRKVMKSGNSAVVTIPASFVKNVGVKVGSQVRVETHPETGQIIYTFSGTKQLPLSNNFVKKKRKKRKTS